MPRWVRVAQVQDLPRGAAAEHVVAGRIVALFHTADDEWWALDGICSHQGGPLARGKLQGCTITCPWHGWQYDVRSGQHITTPLRHPRFPVRIEGDEVLVDLDESGGEGLEGAPNRGPEKHEATGP